MSQKITPSDLAELVAGRRTIHKFQAVTPSENKLKTAIRLAQWAPNHYLTEPWHFYLLGKETVAKIIDLNHEIVVVDKGEAAANAKTKRWRTMPGWFVVTCTITDDTTKQLEDYAACCCAVQNLMLILWNDNIGVKWGTGKVIHDRRFYKYLRINPQTETVVGLFWYGTPADIPKMIRKKTARIITELP